MGVFMHNNNIGIDPSAKRLSYTDDLIEYQTGDQTIDKIPDELIYHVRLRSADRNVDIKKMKDLFKSRF